MPLLRVLVASSVYGESEALRSDDDAADDAQVLLVYGCQDCWIKK